MNIALTGASGFIGRRLLPALRQQGHQVQALYRAPPAQDQQQPGQRQVTGSLQDPASLVRLVTDADLVIHLAGAVRGRNLAAFHQANATGTANLLAAMPLDMPLLLVSSLAARQPQLSHYAASKRAAETLLTGSNQHNWTILRPPAVYGPGDRELQGLFRAWQYRCGLYLHHPGARLSLIHVDDLVRVISTWVASSSTPRQAAAWHQQTFEPDDGTPGGYSWPDLPAAARSAFGHQLLPVPVPPPLLWPLAASLDLVAALGSHWNLPAPMLSRAKLRELDWPDWVCDPAQQPPGWQPRLPLVAGLLHL